MKIHCNLIFIFAFLLLSLGSTSITAQEVEDETEFDYSEDGTKGPTRWGEIKSEWAACNNGEMQSPIDLSHPRVELIPKFGELIRNYKTSGATLKNRGHDITLKWVGDAGSIRINGTVYLLQQCHWHSPSEHSIDGQRYDMEVHMVHASQDQNVKNKIAVIAVFYQIGLLPDPLLTRLRRHIASMADTNEERSIGWVDPREIKMGVSKYYRYLGSLTVPPCTEGVIWFISEELATVSRGQVSLLREAVHDYAEENARPLQPHNRREVHLYHPGFPAAVDKN